MKMLCAHVTETTEDFKISQGAKRQYKLRVMCDQEATRIFNGKTLCTKCFIKIVDIEE